MAGLLGLSRPSEPGEPWLLEPAGAARRDATLSVLLTGQAHGATGQVQQFLTFAESQNVSLAGLWGAYRGDEPVAAALLIDGPGRTAMIFVAPISRRSPSGAMAALLKRLCDSIDPKRTRLLQALLDPGQQRERDALVEAGFNELASLHYLEHAITHAVMHRASTSIGAGAGSSASSGSSSGAGASIIESSLELDPAWGLKAVRWSERDKPLFARAIQASYEATLDCPGLLGLRQMDDIIAGHMGSGQHIAELWLTLFHSDEPAAVMLLNTVPSRQAMELVYLGISKPWRGRGLGGRLVRHALEQARRHDAKSMLLAVDEINTPAMALYRKHGFVATGRKLAMIRVLT
jgi:mycothiol synthase